MDRGVRAGNHEIQQERASDSAADRDSTELNLAAKSLRSRRPDGHEAGEPAGADAVEGEETGKSAGDGGRNG